MLYRFKCQRVVFIAKRLLCCTQVIKTQRQKRNREQRDKVRSAKQQFIPLAFGTSVNMKRLSFNPMRDCCL